jgi:hypothetical protein
LIGKGADASVTDGDGKTLLERATALKQEEIVEILRREK